MKKFFGFLCVFAMLLSVPMAFAAYDVTADTYSLGKDKNEEGGPSFDGIEKGK